MALAEVFEALAGPEAPVEFTAYDGSHAGAAGSPVKITVRSPAAVAYLAQAPGELGLARAYVAGQLDVEGDMYEALARMTKAQSISMSYGGEAAAAAGPRRPEAAAAPDAAAAAGSHADPPLAGRPNALQDPRRQGDLPSLRRVQPVLRVGARAVDGVYLRLLSPPGRDPGRGAGAQVRPGRAQAGAARGHAAARCRLRLGRDGDARGAGVRRQGARGHAVRPAGRLGPGGDRAGGAVRARRGAAPGLPRRAGDRLRRGQLDRPDRARRQAEPARPTSRSCSPS